MIAAAVFVFNFMVNLRLKQINLPAYIYIYIYNNYIYVFKYTYVCIIKYENNKAAVIFGNNLRILINIETKQIYSVQFRRMTPYMKVNIACVIIVS